MKKLFRFSAARVAFALAIAVLVPTLQAEGPAWWAHPGVLNTNAPKDFAPATQGQLKHMATAALAEMEGIFPSGYLADIHAVVDPWSSQSNAKDFSAITIGQLKYVAKPFYNHFSLDLPWTATTADDSDFAIANIGQLKQVFSFDLANIDPDDVDGDAMPNDWEEDNELNPSSRADASEDPDGDGLTNLEEYQQGTDPHDFWNGQPPVLTIISGNQQGQLPGTVLPNPLVARLSNSSGVSPSSGTVTFSITSSSGGSVSPIASGNIDENGLASATLTLPNIPGVSVAVKAQTANGFGNGSVTFTATVGDPSLPPQAPSGASTVRSADQADVVLSWTDNANNESAYYIKRTEDNVTWTTRAMLPPNSTSYTDQGLTPGRCYIYSIVAHND